MTYQTIQTELRSGVALIWLNRPDVRNAMNDVLIDELTNALTNAEADAAVRAIVLAGRGTAFCAGGDLSWMKKAREMTPEQARADSKRLTTVMRLLYEGRKPSVARVHGPAFAGGMGLVAACDIAIAVQEAKFCLSEVKLGLIPAMISPYVIKAMGEVHARRYFLTGEVFEAAEAYRIGFVDELVRAEDLDATVNKVVGHLLLGGPNALAEAKRLIRDVAGKPIDDRLTEDTAARIAKARASDEGQEGITSFFEKRQPSWVQTLGAIDSKPGTTPAKS
jgi:methylglutaconyl-CoA hydratase